MSLSKRTAPSQINSFGSNKQDVLISGTNIKTINGTSLLGSGNITVGVPPLTKVIFVDSGIGDNATADGSISKPYATVEYVLANVINTGTVTATTTNTSATLTSVSSTSSIEVGQYITGTGIPFGTICVSKTSNTIVLSQPCTASATITATWYQPYNVVVTGSHTWVSEWNKIGFYINLKGTAIVGNGTMFGGATVYPIPHKIINDGLIVGDNAGSRIINMTGTQLTNFSLYVDLGNINTIGTNAAITVSLANAYVNIIGNFVYSLGSVLSDGSASAIKTNANFNSYGLLGGIQLGGNSIAGFILKGIHSCPSNVNVLTCYYGNITGSYTGNVIIGSSSFDGRISGTIHSYSGSIINIGSNYSGSSTFTSCIITTLSSLGNVTIASGNSTLLAGTISSTTITGRLINYGSLSGGSVAGAGILDNYGYGDNSGQSNTFTGTVNNYGVFRGFGVNTSSNSYTINNFGTIELLTYALGAGTAPIVLNNYGLLKSTTTTLSNNSAAILLNKGSIFRNFNGGVIDISSITDATKSVINNLGAQIYLYQGTVIKVGNGKSPIKVGVVDNGTTTSTVVNKLVQTGQNFLTTVGVGCRVKNTTDNTFATVTAVDSNTQLSLDTDIMVSGETFEIYGNPNIYNFGTTTNCDASTYGLLIAFDGSSIAPVDLVGGTIYENTAY